MEDEATVPEPKSPDTELCKEGEKPCEASAEAGDAPVGAVEDTADTAETGDIPDVAGREFDSLKRDISQLRELAESISFKLDHNKHQEELIDKLHTENHAYKGGLYKKLLMPLINEIIFLIDGYTQLRKSYAEKDISQIDTQKLLGQFGDIVDDLENALYKNGIEAYEAEEGDAVDFTRQKVIKTVPTDKVEKNKTICACLKKGFILEEKIIRQEQVSCYKFEE